MILATLLTACQLVTIDYVYVACLRGQLCRQRRQIYTYAVDAESGALRPADSQSPRAAPARSPWPSLPTIYNLYVANQGNKSVVHFTIADNGVLTQKDSVTLRHHSRVDRRQPSRTPTSTWFPAPPRPRSLSMPSAPAPSAPPLQPCLSPFPDYPTDTIVPTGVTVLANSNAVYVTAYDKSAYNPGGTHHQQCQSRLALRLRRRLRRRA